jgi:hypothetical protein
MGNSLSENLLTLEADGYDKLVSVLHNDFMLQKPQGLRRFY